MYNDEFDISILSDIEEEISVYGDMRLYYVIDGSLKVRLDATEYIMEKEDVLLINIGAKHGYIFAEKAIIFQIKFQGPISSRVLGQPENIFIYNSAVNTEDSYAELKEVLRKLIYQIIACTHKTESYEMSLCYQLLDIFVENFMREDKGIFEAENVNAIKLQGILQYVNQNYQAHMNLASIAEEMFVSKSTLSRLFKKETGIYFAEYVNQVRLKHAVFELKNSDSIVTRIAMNAGFSSASAFNRIFRETFGITPTEYRDHWRKQQLMLKEKNLELQSRILNEIKNTETDDEASGLIHIEESVQYATHFKKNWNKAINIGSLQKLSRVNIQFQTLNMVKELGFSHVRLWNVFSKQLMISDGINTRQYNYDAVDIIFDFLVTNEINVFIDFGRRPDTAWRSEGVALYFEEEYVDFETRRAWEAAVRGFIHHLVGRYGKDVIKNWIFELTYLQDSPDKTLYKDENFEFYAAFRFFYGRIKSEVPEAEVGGYSDFPDCESDYFAQFLQNCRHDNCVPDFVSFVLFPYERIQKDKTFYKRIPERNMELKAIEKYKKDLAEQNLTKCKIYITEWNSSLSNRNYLNDSCFRSAYFVKKVSELWNSVDMLCCWFSSDWLSSYFDSRSIVNGAAGIITKNNIKKPIWFAFSFLNYLGDELVGIGENYILTKRGETSYAILCFNFKWFACNYFFLSEDEVSLTRIKELFENNEFANLEMILNHIPEDGEYIIKRRQVNSEHGCVLTEWVKMGMDEALERSDIKYIESMSVPYMDRNKIMVRDGKLTLQFQMRDQEITLFHIFKCEK